MALITAKTIITSISLFHLTLAFFFLNSPSTINEQALVYFLGESMGMPYSRAFEVTSPALAFLAAVLAMIGLSDLVSLSMPEEIGMVYYWGTQAPLRSLFSTSMVVYLFLSTGATSVLTAPSKRRYLNDTSSYTATGLRNRLFFTFMFVEMISWFWVWVTLREERDALVEKAVRAEKAARKASQRDD